MASLRFWSLFALGLAVASSAAAQAPVKVRVVIVAMFEPGDDIGDTPGELQRWVEHDKLDRIWDFPQGERHLRSNADGSVLAVVTGTGTIHSAATIMALGLDPRFDLTKAYWVVAGIAGADPNVMSLGSAAWAEWIVDGDLQHEIDAREIPKGWPTGHLPIRRFEPYAMPVKADRGQVFHLNASLVDWAYRLTKDIPLPDSEPLQKHRALYVGFPAAQRPPFILKGDNVAGMNFWHGKLMNEWAEQWVKYFSGGAGNYATCAMEDTGTIESLTSLTRAGKADVSRALVLRTASNFDMQWPGATAIESLSGEALGKGYSGYLASIDNAYLVASKVVHELANHWPQYETSLPK